MPDVECRLKPDPVACACGCGRVGQPRKKVWTGETVGHVKGCECRRCKGGRTKSRASARERRIAKATGGERSPLSGALSGHDVVTGAGTFVEETANVSLVRGFFSWWDGKGTQAKTQRVREQNLAPWAYVVWDPQVRGRGFVIQEINQWQGREQV